MIFICFIIHQCDPTVVICYLIWPCDIAVCITYLISHGSSLSYNTVIFPAGALKTLVLRTRASRAPSVKTSWCTADYINTFGWFCIYNKIANPFLKRWTIVVVVVVVSSCLIPSTKAITIRTENGVFSSLITYMYI